jgi:hypothetical protein
MAKTIEQLTREVLKEILAEQLAAKPKRKYVKSGKYRKVAAPMAIKRPVGRPRKVTSHA